MNRAALIDRIIAHEGDRDAPYDDFTGADLHPGHILQGNVTIGAGINLSAGLSVTERNFLLNNRLNEAIMDLDRNVSWWTELDEIRREVLAEMCYNMGWPKLAGFVKFLAALRRRDFQLAANEMLTSTWAVQVGKRAADLANLMRNGTIII